MKFIRPLLGSELDDLISSLTLKGFGGRIVRQTDSVHTYFTIDNWFYKCLFPGLLCTQAGHEQGVSGWPRPHPDARHGAGRQLRGGGGPGGGPGPQCAGRGTQLHLHQHPGRRPAHWSQEVGYTWIIENYLFSTRKWLILTRYCGSIREHVIWLAAWSMRMLSKYSIRVVLSHCWHVKRGLESFRIAKNCPNNLEQHNLIWVDNRISVANSCDKLHYHVKLIFKTPLIVSDCGKLSWSRPRRAGRGTRPCWGRATPGATCWGSSPSRGKPQSRV